LPLAMCSPPNRGWSHAAGRSNSTTATTKILHCMVCTILEKAADAGKGAKAGAAAVVEPRPLVTDSVTDGLNMPLVLRPIERSSRAASGSAESRCSSLSKLMQWEARESRRPVVASATELIPLL